MKVKNKYYKMLMFASLFDKFNDGDNLVDIEENDSTHQKLIELNNEPIYVDSLQELIDKYDYDCDGKISIIDVSIPMWITVDTINSNDPKYDATNKTYNGKSLDIDNDNNVDVADPNKLIFSIKSKIRSYFGVTMTYDYQEQLDDIKSYYTNHNYTWPTLEQIEYFTKNGEWPTN